MSALTSYTVSTFLLMARRDGATISDAAINAAIDRIGSEGTTEDTGNALVAAVAGHLGDGSADAIAAGLSGLLGGSLKQGVIDGSSREAAAASLRRARFGSQAPLLVWLLEQTGGGLSAQPVLVEDTSGPVTTIDPNPFNDIDEARSFHMEDFLTRFELAGSRSVGA